MTTRRVHTSAKFTKGVFGVPSSFLQLKQAPSVIHDVLLVFRVHRVHLSVLTALIKERTEEELSKPGNKQKKNQSSYEAPSHPKNVQQQKDP